MRAFSAVFVAISALRFGAGASSRYPLIFFIIVVTLFPLALSPTVGQLREIGTGVLWVAALLSALLALDGLFRSDADDGSLEQLLLSPAPLTISVLAKVAAHTLVTLVPLICLVPLTRAVIRLAASRATDARIGFTARDAYAQCARRIGRGPHRELASRRIDRRLARVADDGAAIDLRHARN